MTPSACISPTGASRSSAADQARCAIVLPGGLHGPFTPLLKYAADAATDRGAHVRPVWWTDYDRPLTLEPEERTAWVETHLAGELSKVVANDAVLLIGRSLGSYGAGIAAERCLPAIWFNPILTSAEVVTALDRRCAPVMLVGGTADPMWDPLIARRLSERVVEIPHADHALRVPGPLARTAAALAESITEAESFLDECGW